MLNIVCTSKPCDGLFYYSYEYCSHLNEKGIPAQVYVITHRDFTSGDYTESLNDKYIHCKNIVFNNDYIPDDCITLIMGRSMMTLAHWGWNDYRSVQKESLKKLFGNKVISVYSENHPKDYPKALKFFKPTEVIDLCDTDVYPNGVGEHFEKIIHFPIYKEVEEDIQFDHLFLGTNSEYYEGIEKIIDDYPDHGILTYHQKYINFEHNNLRSPVPNLLGKFKTYVYTKDTFDPAPRLFQEARWLGKKIIYHRKNPTKDGGYWYWKRGIKAQDIMPILTAIDTLNGKISLETELVVRDIPHQFGALMEAENIEISVVTEKLIEQIENNEIWFCSIPWIMAFTDEEGNYAQCNFGERQQLAHGEAFIINEGFDDMQRPIQEIEYLPYKQGNTLHDTSLKEWMTGSTMENIRREMVDQQSDYEFVNHHCKKCINDEKGQKLTSRRLIANSIYKNEKQIWRHVLEGAARTKRGEGYEFKGRILEIQVKSFGIECNLDCHMCHHMSSSIRTKMAFENDVWNDVVWGDKENAREKSVNAMRKKPVDEINNQIIELAPHIYNLKIIGGEPLIMKKHYELLDRLIEIDEAKNIQLKYQTNATELKVGKHNVLKYIPHFWQVLVVVSLDGIEGYNDYIRRRSDYWKIYDNIKIFSKFPNVIIDINSVVTFFSVLHLHEIPSVFPTYLKNWWPVDMPSQMKANNLPQDIKDRLIPIYENTPPYEEIADLLRLPADPDFNPVELYKYCIDMDSSYEGTKWQMNLLEVFPELKPHFLETTGKGWHKDYCIEMPQITGVVDSVQDFYKKILKEKPIGEVWYEGITHHRIPKEHPVYDIVNEDLFHTGEMDWVGVLDAAKIESGEHKAEIRAYLSVQNGDVDFIPHIDSGYVLIFPFEISENSNYKLQYLNKDRHEEIVYEHEYREDENGNVIPILHNGPNHWHTVNWESTKDKYWVQIILNPKEGGWEGLLKAISNKTFFKRRKK